MKKAAVATNTSFHHVARIEVGEPMVFDECDLNDRIWCARNLRLIGHDGSVLDISIHSDERELPVMVRIEREDLP